MRLAVLLLPACLILLTGCNQLPPALSAVDHVLDVLCETRTELKDARADIESGNYAAAVARLYDYLKKRHAELEALHPRAPAALPTPEEAKAADPEVGAALTLLEAELARRPEASP
jgi:hypothetical protein